MVAFVASINSNLLDLSSMWLNLIQLETPKLSNPNSIHIFLSLWWCVALPFPVNCVAACCWELIGFARFILVPLLSSSPLPHSFTSLLLRLTHEVGSMALLELLLFYWRWCCCRFLLLLLITSSSSIFPEGMIQTPNSISSIFLCVAGSTEIVYRSFILSIDLVILEWFQFVWLSYFDTRLSNSI